MHRSPAPARTRRAAALVTAAIVCLTAAGCSSGTDGTPAPVESAAGTQEPKEPKGGQEPTQAPETPVSPLALNADGLLAGNAVVGEYPPGDPGVVSAVFVGLVDERGTVPFVFRNNTAEAISHVDASATARDGAGTLVGTGTSQGTNPAQVPPGGLGMAYIYFGDPVPADAEYEFTFDTSPADTSSYNTADLRVAEAVPTGEAIVGTAVNETGEQLQGPFSVAAYCFDEAGSLTQVVISFANEDGPIDDGATVSFTIDLYGDPCATFLVGVRGYFD